MRDAAESLRLARIDEKISERLRTRAASYDPWRDLGRRTGVDVQWHSGPVGRWERPWGVTFFDRLSITLLNCLGEMQLRETITHELIHLERGPSPAGRPEATEEAFVNSLAARRLVDPVLWDLLAERGSVDLVRGGEVFRILRVSPRFARVYADWRKRVKPATAHAAWEQFSGGELPAWPATWMNHHRDSPWISLAFGEQAALA